MYVCMYVCMHACMHARTYACMCVCALIFRCKSIPILHKVIADIALNTRECCQAASYDTMCATKTHAPACVIVSRYCGQSNLWCGCQSQSDLSAFPQSQHAIHTNPSLTIPTIPSLTMPKNQSRYCGQSNHCWQSCGLTAVETANVRQHLRCQIHIHRTFAPQLLPLGQQCDCECTATQ